jgi:hypothetical protein
VLEENATLNIKERILRNEPPPNPTTFNITNKGVTQFLINPGAAADAQKCVEDPTVFDRIPAFLAVFVIFSPSNVKLTYAPVGRTPNTYSMDGAINIWETLLKDGWVIFDGEHWYKRSRKYGLAVLNHEKVEDYQKIACIEGKVRDLGHGCCILEYVAASVNPTFHRRRRKIVSIK